jgi:hypothetical protein
MKPCLEVALSVQSGPESIETTSGCSKYAQEVDDARAYMQLLEGVWDEKHPPAARLLLGLHDVISKTIGLKYRPEGRRRIYCWLDFEEELKKLPSFLALPERQTMALPSGTAAFMEMYAKVPGLGNDNCDRLNTA